MLYLSLIQICYAHLSANAWCSHSTVQCIVKNECIVQERSHLDFVCRLKDFMTRAAVTEGVIDALAQAGFQAVHIRLDEVEEVMKRDYIRNTRVIDL